MKRLLALFASLCATFLVAAPARSHHSNSAFHVEQIIELKGVVKEWHWSNPHTRLFLTVDDGKGGKVEWEAEGRAPGVLRRVGWEKSTLTAGETVSIYCSPAKDGSKACLIARVTKADGTILSNGGAN